jgi:hypothetical protein
MAAVSEPVKVPDPWERQAAESEEAWLAFRCYRDMPPDERMLRRSANRETAVLSKWNRDHNWADRVKAYDAHFDALSVEERRRIYKRKAEELAIDHMIVLADMRDLATREFAKFNQVSRETEVETMKPRDVIRLAETVVKLDRLVRGETTENVGTSVDTSKLSLAEMETLADLLRKAGAQ